MSLAQQLPQRQKTAPNQAIPLAGPPAFEAQNLRVHPASVAADMGDLATRVRQLMRLHQAQVLQLPLGGYYFDIVVTASGLQGHAVMTVMDQIQHTGDERADACGPVIEDPQRSWLIWLVPPGTSDQWGPHRYATCLGRPHNIALPSDDRDGAARPLLASPLPRRPTRSADAPSTAARPVPARSGTSRISPRLDAQQHVLISACGEAPVLSARGTSPPGHRGIQSPRATAAGGFNPLQRTAT